MSLYITVAAHNCSVARVIPYSTTRYAAMLHSFPECFISSNRHLFNHGRKNLLPHHGQPQATLSSCKQLFVQQTFSRNTGIRRLRPTEVEELLEPRERNILQHNAVPDISKISTKKWNLFHSLGLSLQIPLMDELLEQGWDINSVDKDGYTALHMAVIGKKEAVISHLLRKGANPHIRDQEGATALHYAVQAGAMQTVKLLIKYKVDVNVADNDGWTPLHISMQSRSRDVAKVLLVNGADKTRRTKDGKTPLDLSMCYGRDFKSYDLAKLLKLDLANRSI